MRALYRLVFRDGTHGAWSGDIDRIREDAEYFRTEIEERKFGNVNK